MYSLKLLSDLFLYWSAACLIMFFAGNSLQMAGSILCCILVFLLYRGISLRFPKRRFLRFFLFPLLPAPLWLFTGFFSFILILLPACYCAYLIFSDKPGMDNGEMPEQMVFKIFIAFVMQVMGFAFGKGFPYMWVFIGFASAAILHKRLYQLYGYGELNRKTGLFYGAGLALFLLAAGILGIPFLWEIVYNVFSFIFCYTIRPVLLILATILAYVFAAIFWLVARLFHIDFSGMQMEEQTTVVSEINKLAETGTAGSFPWLRYILFAILALVILFIAYRLFLNMRSSLADHSEISVGGIIKQNVLKPKRRGEVLKGNRGSVRNSYIKVLKRLNAELLSVTAQTTTEEVASCMEGLNVSEDCLLLLSLYRKARYDEREEITSEEARLARELSKRILKNLETE